MVVVTRTRNVSYDSAKVSRSTSIMLEKIFEEIDSKHAYE